MADDIEVTVVLTDEEFGAYRKVAETHHEGPLDIVKAKLLDLLLVQLEEPLSRGAYPDEPPWSPNQPLVGDSQHEGSLTSRRACLGGS